MNGNELNLRDDFVFVIDNETDDYVPYIIPPIASKNSSGVFSAVWEQAATELSNATRIVIIGYSFPQTDNHIRYLIANGLSKNSSLREIHIWDTKPNKVQENWGQLSTYSRILSNF